METNKLKLLRRKLGQSKGFPCFGNCNELNGTEIKMFLEPLILEVFFSESYVPGEAVNVKDIYRKEINAILEEKIQEGCQHDRQMK